MLLTREFSRLSQISIRSLRHYDEIGLLKPAYVNPINGYRHYDPDQLVDAQRIFALRQIGFSLPEIANILQSEQNDTVTNLYQERREQIERQLQEYALRLSNVDFQLASLTQYAQVHADSIIRKRTPTQTILTRRQILMEGQMITPCFVDWVRLVRQYLPVTATQYLVGIYHPETGKEAGWDSLIHYERQDGTLIYSSERPGGEPNDLETAYVVDTDQLGEVPHQLEKQNVQLRTLPSVEVASIVYRGKLHERYRALLALDRWMEHHQMQLAGPTREIYFVVRDDAEFTQNIIEIQYPIRPM